MKKFFAAAVILSLFIAQNSFAEDKSAVRHFHAEGEVVSVDPAYSRIIIKHDPIKGFPGQEDTNFSVVSKDLLKKISTADLVSFDIEETRGDVQIVKIERIGQATAKDDRMPLGTAAQDVLEGAGTVVKTVASPIAPVGQVANAAADATTNTTGSVLKDADTQVKHKF